MIVECENRRIWFYFIFGDKDRQQFLFSTFSLTLKFIKYKCIFNFNI